MSYDPALSTDRDKIRFNLGDTLSKEILSDETLDALLVSMSFEAAVRGAARAMVAVISKKPEEVSESGGVTFKWKDRLKALEDIAEGKTSIIFSSEAKSAPLSGQIDLLGADKFR